MKIFIILTTIGAYLALGILIVSLICKTTDSVIDLDSESDIAGTGVCVILWPLLLIAAIVVLFFKGLSYGVNLVMKAFNNNNNNNN